MLRFLLLVCLSFLTGLNSLAQDLSGSWKGRLVMAPSGCFPVYNLQFELEIKDSLVRGTALHYSDSLNFVKQQLQGVYRSDSQVLLLRETAIIGQQLKADCIPCTKQYRLTYHRASGINTTDEQIRGTWFTVGGLALDGKTSCDPGSVVLNRASVQSTEQNKRAATLRDKTNALFKEILVDSGLVQIELFDNGQIDGDTISVYVNERSVVYRKMLKSQAVSLSVLVDRKKPVQDVVMVGENLGSIPPNTALMIVMAGKERYQLYLKADEKQNALVRFIYKEKTEDAKN
ncbi:MAG: hypothetical protein ACKO41_05065 [Sphingomonadales bacterium]